MNVAAFKGVQAILLHAALRSAALLSSVREASSSQIHPGCTVHVLTKNISPQRPFMVKLTLLTRAHMPDPDSEAAELRHCLSISLASMTSPTCSGVVG